MQVLLKRWTELCARLGVTGDAVTAAGRKIVDSYDEAGRHYHDRAHLGSVLHHLDWAKENVTETQGLFDPEKQKLFDTVELALWYHDVVYNPKAQDNEAQSRNRLLTEARQLGIAEDVAKEAAALVDVTARHMTARGRAENIMVDCDLASLGETPTAFMRNNANIRKEYAHVPAPLFTVGQNKIMGAFLKEKRIYKTEAFYRCYEEQARKNLAALTASPIWRVLRRFLPK